MGNVYPVFNKFDKIRLKMMLNFKCKKNSLFVFSFIPKTANFHLYVLTSLMSTFIRMTSYQIFYDIIIFWRTYKNPGSAPGAACYLKTITRVLLFNNLNNVHISCTFNTRNLFNMRFCTFLTHRQVNRQKNKLRASCSFDT